MAPWGHFSMARDTPGEFSDILPIGFRTPLLAIPEPQKPLREGATASDWLSCGFESFQNGPLANLFL